MNVLDPAKARYLYRLFSYGHGVRESARLAGVNRNTITKYRREWLRVRARLQEAYDALWEHQCERCDAITATLPDDPAIAMLDVWLNDQFDMPKSGFYDHFDGEIDAAAKDGAAPSGVEVSSEKDADENAG